MGDVDRYDRLFELSRDAVVEIELIDQVPIVRAVNPAFEAVFGYERDQIVGESLNDVIVPDSCTAEATSFDERTESGKYNEATVSRKTSDGIREFRYRSEPFERDGSARALGIYTDVTDRNRRDRHHAVLHRVLRHNLRNDLTPILAATEALTETTDDETVQQYVSRIRTATEDLIALSEAAGKVETMFGSDASKRYPVDAVATVQRIVTKHRNDHPNVIVVTETPESCRVSADHRLGEALDALIENAIEHGVRETSSGADYRDAGSEPSASQTRPLADGRGQSAGRVPADVDVHVSIRKNETEGVVSIADTGPGIPEHEQAAVFNDESVSQLSHGSGLGLWLAKWVVESYGGRLTYQRRGGETLVTARIPLADDRFREVGYGRPPPPK